MNDDMHPAPSKPDGQRFCHVCAHPLAEGLETCPECNSPVVNVQQLLESTRRVERPKSKGARRRLEMALTFDILLTGFIFVVLAGSLGVIGRILHLARTDGLDNNEITYWIGGYGILVLVAITALIKIDRANIRQYMKRLKK